MKKDYKIISLFLLSFILIFSSVSAPIFSNKIKSKLITQNLIYCTKVNDSYDLNDELEKLLKINTQDDFVKKCDLNYESFKNEKK